jgi:hypothetical protein
LGFELREAFTDANYTRLKEGGDAATDAKIATVKACLRCHSTRPLETDSLPPNSRLVPLAEGVSCQGCHGPAERWINLHQFRTWRAVTPTAKAALGFMDVRTTPYKAKLCASCHVGDTAQQQLVKHEWYAAGHPPLPGFELASFAQQMPIHWRPLAAKGDFAFLHATPPDNDGRIAQEKTDLARAGVPAEAIKSSYLEANFPSAREKGLDPASDLPRTKDAIVSGVVVLESYVRLVGDYAAQAAENRAAWPELALYDCSACHHELRSGLGLRNRPMRRHIPGRPPLATWPLALTRLGAHQATHYDPAQADAGWSRIDSQLLRLEAAITSRPFGDPAAIHAAARPLVESLSELSLAVSNTRYDPTAARRASAFLTDPSQLETNDYYSARQIAWAIREIAADQGASENRQLFVRGDDDVLSLALPSGQERSVLDNLNHWLPAAARYDPDWFREELKAARTRLGIQ